MPKTIWTCLVLFFLFLVLTESKRGGSGRTGGWGSSWRSWSKGSTGNKYSNLSPSHSNIGGQNPANSGQSGRNWNQNHGSNRFKGPVYRNYHGGSSYNEELEPDEKNPNMKMAAGAIGGFVLGSAYSNMRYNFGNDMDYRYYNTYRNEMPNQVYRPQYTGSPYISQDRFVSDCFNTTMTEYVIKPNEEKNTSEVNETEVRVKSTIIQDLCISEYMNSPKYYNYGACNNHNPVVMMIFSSIFILFILLFLYFVAQCFETLISQYVCKS